MRGLGRGAGGLLLPDVEAVLHAQDFVVLPSLVVNTTLAELLFFHVTSLTHAFILSVVEGKSNPILCDVRHRGLARC